MAKSAKKAPPTVDLVARLPALEAALQGRGALKTTELGKLGVPAAQRADAIALLVQGGAEAFKGGARIPLKAQLVARADEQGALPLTGLAKRLAGAAQAEAKTAAEALVREGKLRLVVRGKAEVLAPAAAHVLEPDELRALARIAKALAAQADKALKSRAVPKTLLRSDVREPLLELVGSRSSPQPKPPEAAVEPQDLMEPVLRAVQGALRADLGLSYVPDVMRSLMPAHGIGELHAVLLEAARARRVELRPESGLGRLTPEELALCPAGAHGTRLSWARPLAEHER